MTAVAGAAAAVPVEPALAHPAVVKPISDRRRGLLHALLGMAQFSSVLDASVLLSVMDEHGYLSAADRKATS